MAYGIIKIDTVTFTDAGIDKSVSISGLVQNPTFSGNVTVTGTVSGNTIQGQTISGVTVTGTTSTFATGFFVSLTGTTIQGTTASYTSGGFTSLTGVTTSGTTANFVSGVFSTQLSGATVTGTTASFTSGVFANISGGTHTITSGVFAAGSAASPSISFTSDPNTGIYSPGADQVALSTNGTGKLFIDSAGKVTVKGAGTAAFVVEGSAPNNSLVIKDTTGNVGIGTSSPQALLECNDSANDIQARFGTLSAARNPAIRLQGRNAANTQNCFADIKLDSENQLLILSDPGTTSGSVGANPVVIDSSGRLLVGTSTSLDLNAPIQAASTTFGVESFRFSTSATGTGGAIDLSRSNSGTVGTTAAIVSGQGLGIVRFRGAADGSTYLTGAQIEATSDGGTVSATSMPTRLVFSVTADGAASPTEALRISSNRAITVSDGGNVVLGTTTGTKIGTTTTQKLGFYNATPVVQPAAVADATAATVITQLNDLLAKLRTLGIIAT